LLELTGPEAPDEGRLSDSAVTHEHDFVTVSLGLHCCCLMFDRRGIQKWQSNNHNNLKGREYRQAVISPGRRTRVRHPEPVSDVGALVVPEAPPLVCGVMLDDPGAVAAARHADLQTFVHVNGGMMSYRGLGVPGVPQQSGNITHHIVALGERVVSSHVSIGNVGALIFHYAVPAIRLAVNRCNKYDLL